MDATVATNRELHEYIATPWYRRKERAWHASHGMGLEFLAERALAAVSHNAPTDNCYGMQKEIADLVACVEQHVAAKNTTITCKNHFWDGSD